jgi:hypothetical protein
MAANNPTVEEVAAVVAGATDLDDAVNRCASAGWAATSGAGPLWDRVTVTTEEDDVWCELLDLMVSNVGPVSARWYVYSQDGVERIQVPVG